MANGLNGLIEKFCSSNVLKKNTNNEGANSIFIRSICAGVIRITKDKSKISTKYFLLMFAKIMLNSNEVTE